MTLINTTTRNAFYTIHRWNSNVIVRFGAIGTKGQIRVFEFADARSAQVFLEEKIESKMGRHYVQFVAA
jgi:predicted DNA-binding WGR domain protein